MSEFEKALMAIYSKLDHDGYGYWLPEWCMKAGDAKPSFEEFVKELQGRL